MKKRIIAASVLGFLLTLSWLGFFWLNKSTITVSVSGADVVSRIVTVDSQLLAAHGAEGKNYSASVSQGNHKLVVKASGYKEYSANVETGFRENKSIDVTLDKSNATDIAAAVKSIPLSRVVNARFFGGERWMVFFVSSNTGRGEGQIVIAKYSQSNSRWEIASEGTDFDFDAPSLRNAPSELVNYVKSLR